MSINAPPLAGHYYFAMFPSAYANKSLPIRHFIHNADVSALTVMDFIKISIFIKKSLGEKTRQGMLVPNRPTAPTSDPNSW